VHERHFAGELLASQSSGEQAQSAQTTALLWGMMDAF